MKLDQYLKKKKQEVADKQAEIVCYAMDTLFKNSPHIGNPESPWAEGEYEINHKISINGKFTSHYPPVKRNSKDFKQASERSEDFMANIMEGPDTEGALVELKKTTGLNPDELPAAIMKENVTHIFIEKEKLKTNKIECGDTVKIFNDTAHADDVEDGGEHWRAKPNGYGTYRKTKRAVKAKYNNVIE